MINTFAGFTKIDDFVNYKLSLLEQTDKSLKSLFELMFSEKQNIFCESTDGYKINKVTYGESRTRVDKKATALSSLLCEEPKGSIIG